MPMIGGRFYSPEEIEEMALSPFDMPPIRQSPINPQGQGPIQSPISQSPIQAPPPSGIPTAAPLEPMDAPPPAAPMNISGEPVAGMDEPGSQIHIQTLPPNVEPPNNSPYADIFDALDDPVMRSMFRDMYKPETEMRDRLVRMLESFPIRKQPGKLDRIKAMLSGLSTAGHPQREPYAAAEVEDALRGPYNRELSDWKLRADLGKDLAINERQANVNQRTAAAQIMADERGRQRILADMKAREARDLQSEADRAERARQFDETNARLNRAEDRLAQTATAQQKRLDRVTPVTTQQTKDGKVVVVWSDKTTSTFDLDIWGKYQEEVKRHEDDMAEIEARTRGQIEAARARGEEARKTNADRPGRATGTGTQPTPQNVVNARDAAFNQWVKEWKIANPKFASYVRNPKGKYEGIGGFGVDIPGYGVSKADYDAKMEEVRTKLEEYRSGKLDSTLRMGGAPTITSTQTQTPAPAPPPQGRGRGTAPIAPNQPLPQGMIIVERPDGQQGLFPRNRATTLPQGWKVVRDK